MSAPAVDGLLALNHGWEHFKSCKRDGPKQLGQAEIHSDLIVLIHAPFPHACVERRACEQAVLWAEVETIAEFAVW